MTKQRPGEKKAAKQRPGMAKRKALPARIPFVPLRPGEMVVAENPAIITTLLGSAVAVCLYSPREKIGAMCHCLLPSPKTRRKNKPLCYVDSCLARMIRVVGEKHHAALSDIKGKLFGGGKLQLAETGHGPADRTIGRQHIEAARTMLREHGITVIAEKVGGDHGYKLFFNSQTGEVFLQRVSGPALNNNPEAAQRGNQEFSAPEGRELYKKRK